MKYHFYSAGALPILGGIYAGVVVEVDDDHTKILSITPLSSNPSPVPAIEEIAPVSEGNTESPKES